MEENNMMSEGENMEEQYEGEGEYDKENIEEVNEEDGYEQQSDEQYM